MLLRAGEAPWLICIDGTELAAAIVGDRGPGGIGLIRIHGEPHDGHFAARGVGHVRLGDGRARSAAASPGPSRSCHNRRSDTSCNPRCRVRVMMAKRPDDSIGRHLGSAHAPKPAPSRDSRIARYGVRSSCLHPGWLRTPARALPVAATCGTAEATYAMPRTP